MAQPMPKITHLRLGREWHVVVIHQSGQREHIRRFQTRTEAKRWIRLKAKAWLEKRGYWGD
jgi:hypothetical protein